jgi:hypothetical protein
MRQSRLAALCGAMVLWSGVAAAEVLISPPLVAEGDRVLDCYLVNVGQRTRSVKIEVFNRDGDVVKTVRTRLEPYEEDVARTDASLAGRVCKFTVPGTRNEYRASILVRELGVGAISALPAF